MVTNASQTRLGASLIQDQDEGELPVAFAFKVNLPTVFRLVTDHAALKWLMTSKDLAGKLYRWAIQLQELDFEIVHRPGGSNVAADALSKATVRTVRASERDRTSERDQRGSSQSGAGDEGQILDDEIRGEKAHDKTAKKLREKSKCNDRAIVVADEIVCIRETDGSSRVLLPTALWVKVLKENHDSERKDACATVGTVVQGLRAQEGEDEEVISPLRSQGIGKQGDRWAPNVAGPRSITPNGNRNVVAAVD
ncbi:hypothetical protein PI124_g6336 [Phytophthora idaei]|nr:hypothetical protein PI124_g6336 [Phytophthora idaei]